MKIIYTLLNFFYRALVKANKEVKRLKYRELYDIDVTVSFWHNTTITGGGQIFIDKNTYIGQNSYVSSQQGATIKIGKNCRISHNVHIRTGSYTIASMMKDQPDATSESIIIGDNVWIGLNVYIKGGVTIGSGAVIGANSVVLSDIGSNQIYAGIPAKLIKDLNE